MALIRELNPTTKQVTQVHGEVEGSYVIFSDPKVGTILQIETYGSSDRKLEGKISQSVQFDLKSAEKLLRLLREAFPGLA